MQIKGAFIFILFFILFQHSYAQKITNSAIAEQESTRLYYTQDWKKLGVYTEKAISNGYDYYYMRMRSGISYFEQKKYVKAIRHFQKALFFNSDTLAQEYLYYSYLFSGRVAEAKMLTKTFSDKLIKKIKPSKNKIIESIYTEGGVGLTNLENNYQNIDIDGLYDIYGEATINKTMRYLHVGLNHQVTNNLSIYHGYSNIGIDLLRKIKFNNKDTLDSYKLTQHDYYITSNIQLKGISIAPAFHFINVGFGRLNASYNSLQYKYIFSKKDTSFVNYVTSLALSKSVGIFTYGLSSSYSQLNSYNQLQIGLSASYLPLANNNLYGSTNIVLLNENNENRIIIAQKLGAKIISRLWAEAGITYGNLQNYNENNAFVVFNTGDKILYKYGVALIAPFHKNIELSIRYDRFNRESTYYRMNNLLNIEPVTVNYNTQTIVGGIKCTF
ncbi:MAG: hypothetical protein WBM13_08150 [Bacteroidia bacterium]